MKHGKERQMAGEASRNKVNIGASSLILIFIVLCMATFGLLSLSSAQGDLKLAGRNGEAVRAYYEADSRGQQWLYFWDIKAGNVHIPESSSEG